MEVNESLNAEIMKIVDTQLKGNDPPETKKTFLRLQKEGFNKMQSKQMIGQCIVVEVFDVMKLGREFNEERFIQNLNALPKEPFD